jgi:hypothetical protein
MDEAKSDREIRRTVMRSSAGYRGTNAIALRTRQPATRISALTRVSVVYLAYMTTTIPRRGTAMSTHLIIRLEPQLKDQVARLARAEGKTTSEVVRELLEDYVASRDIAASVDGL